MDTSRASSNAIVLYLDFDGVLHDDEIYWSPKRGIYGKTPGRTLFEWAPLLEDILKPYPEVRIVLSTSWVRVKSFNYAKYKLPASLQSRVIGATYHRRQMVSHEFAATPRGRQVYADVLRRSPGFWMAIDDDPDGWPDQFRDNVVLTQQDTGISPPGVQAEIVRVIEKGRAHLQRLQADTNEQPAPRSGPRP
jgi:hypothetical protein